MFFNMLFFIVYSLIMDQSLVGFKRNQRDFEVAEKSFNEVSYKVRVSNMFKILIVSLTKLVQGLIFFID